MMTKHIRLVAGFLLVGFVFCGPAYLGTGVAQDPAPSVKPPIDDFAKYLSGTVLTGVFTVDGKPLDKLTEERYEIKSAKKVGAVLLISAQIADGIGGDDLRKIALELRNRKDNSVVALISNVDGKPVLVVAASDGARSSGVKAGALVKIGSTVLGGGGGGKDDFAQGGGTEISSAPDALLAIENSLLGK
jgi:hypothetical protein